MSHQSIFSSHKYIEYQPGTLNLILSVPHGGIKRPSSIANRDAGRLVNGKCVYDHASSGDKDMTKYPVKYKRDILTQEFSIMLADKLESIVGKRPHIIMNHLYRGKFDANCDLGPAAFNEEDAVDAWYNYHKFIDQAKSTMTKNGLLLDIHGHSHVENWVELGYTISGRLLDSGTFTAEESSIYSLSKRLQLTEDSAFKTLIHGPKSLGALIAKQGYITVPSPDNPSPMGGNYYSGGYNTRRHGSCSGGYIDAVQLESPRMVRKNKISQGYVKAVATALAQYLELYYS